MEAHVTFVVFFMLVLAFQVASKVALDCESQGDYSSPVYALSVTGAMTIVFLGARLMVNLSVTFDEEKEELWEKSEEFCYD